MELQINAEDINYRELSPLVLAYVGDAVFELLVRGYVLKGGNAPVNKLNGRARRIVNAASQSKMYYALEEIATDEELAVLKRGRNAKSFTAAKNQSITDYRRATGVEALFGYTYLKRDNERLAELFDKCIQGL